jgi:hypothetical protein
MMFHPMRRFPQFLLALLLLPTALSAQVENLPIKEKLSNPIYVVLDADDDEEFHALLREGLEKTWAISQYRFIEKSELDELKKDVNNVFLMHQQKEGFDGDVRLYPDVLILAHFARDGRYRNNLAGAAIDPGSSLYGRMTVFHALRLIQDKTRFKMAKQNGQFSEYEDFVLVRNGRVQELNLHLHREAAGLEKADLQKVYNGPFTLLSRKEMSTIVESPPKGAAYAFVYEFDIPGTKVTEKSVVDADTGEVLYYNTSAGPGSSGTFGKKDWKSLE